MSGQTIVLVTGAKAGIGRGLLQAYAKRPNTLAIAAIRDGPSSAPAKDLTSLPVGSNSKIIVVRYDASSPTAAVELDQELRNTHSITHLDIVVANAGVLNHFGLVAAVKTEELQQHFTINTVAPILLYQRTAALLKQSKQEPKFFVISSTIGSNGLMDNYPMPMTAYGMSKAAVNFAMGKIHREEERIIVCPVQPGWVQTAMGEKAATLNGMEAKDVPVTLEQSVTGLIGLFDKANKKDFSGRFWDQNHQELPW